MAVERPQWAPRVQRHPAAGVGGRTRQPLAAPPQSSAPVAPMVIAPAPAVAAPDFLAVLLDIVGERTGYPAEMLDLDLVRELAARLSLSSQLAELARRFA